MNITLSFTTANENEHGEERKKEIIEDIETAV